jgi:hypothetical protein
MPETYYDVPELLLENRHDKVIRASANLVSILPFKPISISANTLNFTFNTPSFNTLMSEKVLISLQSLVANFQFTGTPAQAVPFATLGGISLRSFPLERLISTCQIVLGSTSQSYPIADILEATAFASYSNDEFSCSSASFDSPVEEVGSCMGASVGTINLPAGSAATLLCAQTSSSTGQLITSGVPGGVPKRGSLNIERIFDPSAPTVATGGVNYNPQTGLIQAVANPVVSVQFSISTFLRLPILSWLKEAKESLSALSQIQINFTLLPLQTIFNYLEPFFFNATAAGPMRLASGGITFNTNYLQPSNITLSIRFITPPASYSAHDITRQFYQID